MNITEVNTSPFSKGSIFRTFPEKSQNLKDGNIEIMVASNMPSDAGINEKYFTQSVSALFTGGNAIKDGGEMSCMFLWIEFFKWLNQLRRASHDEKIVPFAIGVADGEIGYNIDARFSPDEQGAISEDNKMLYRSNNLFSMYPKDNVKSPDEKTELAKKLKFDSDNTPLFRYFVPVLNPDITMR